MASAPRTVGLLWLLAVSLGAIRYFAKYFRASVRSCRIRSQKHTGVTPRPPVFDVTHEAYSPFVVCLQFLSALLVSGPGGFGKGPASVHNIFFHHTADGGRRDSWTAEEVEDKLRIVSVCVSVSMHWWHTR